MFSFDTVSMQQWSPEQQEGLRVYLGEKVAAIRAGASTDETEQDSDALWHSVRPKRQAFYRAGFSQMWSDIETGLVHTVLAVDTSRICRNADLYVLFLEMVGRAKCDLVSLMQDTKSLKVTRSVDRGLIYLLASLHEDQSLTTSLNSFRGMVACLKNGNPIGKIPWWLSKDKSARQSKSLITY